MNKTALIIGATGLVGSNLLKQLLLDNDFSSVKIFVRRATGITHPKLKEFIIDFDKLELSKGDITGDVLFSCMGTTLKQAGSKEAQYKVDFTYQYEFAKLAAENGVADYLLISAASSSSKSKIFYSRIKGELEDAIKQLTFSRISILQPSVLAGERSEKRIGEKWGAGIINMLGMVVPFLKKYRSIPGATVAHALIELYKKKEPEMTKTYKLDELFL